MGGGTSCTVRPSSVPDFAIKSSKHGDDEANDFERFEVFDCMSVASPFVCYSVQIVATGAKLVLQKGGEEERNGALSYAEIV